MNDIVTGQCLCGAVQYQAERSDKNFCYCHCHSCRMASGAPFMVWGTFALNRFKVTQGELKMHRSSAKVERGFCGNCGTAITYYHEARADELDISLTTLNELEQFVPSCHIWVEDKVAWLQINDGLPQYQQWRTS